MSVWSVPDRRKDEPVGDKWLLELPHLSATQLNMFIRCPESYRLRYVLGIKDPPNFNLVLGKGFHLTAEHNFGQKIESGVDLPVREVVEFFHDEAVAKAIEIQGADIAWEDKKPDDVHVTGGKMVEAYQKGVSPRVKPVAVELEKRIDVPGVPVPVLGYVDVVEENNAIDLKTSGKKLTKMKPSWRIQGRVYQLMTGKPIHWHVITKTKEPEALGPLEYEGLLQPLASTEGTHSLISTIAWQINDLMTRFGPDDPWPVVGYLSDNNPCGWCGYRQRCTAWGGDGYRGVSFR